MRIKKLLWICMCCAMVAPALWGQTVNSHASPGILGYLDPHTGAFLPVPQPDASVDINAATTFTGTVTVTLTITLKTTALTNISCTGSLSVVDGTMTPRVFAESDTVAATGTGTTRTCAISIHYSWGLNNQATDNMSTNYSVFGSTGQTGLPQRIRTLSPLDTRKVPANGATTALTAAVTL